MLNSVLNVPFTICEAQLSWVKAPLVADGVHESPSEDWWLLTPPPKSYCSISPIGWSPWPKRESFWITGGGLPAVVTHKYCGLLPSLTNASPTTPHCIFA